MSDPYEPPDGATGVFPDQTELLQTLLRAHAQGASLRELIEMAPLRAEQRAAAELLLDLNDRASTETITPLHGNENGADAVARLEAELADLRRANDALASALGACPLCWGGDDACTVCRGRGRPGYAVPDRRLFGELVLPAVARVRDVQRSSPPSRASRGGRGEPLSSEVRR